MPGCAFVLGCVLPQGQPEAAAMRYSASSQNARRAAAETPPCLRGQRKTPRHRLILPLELRNFISPQGGSSGL